MIIVSQYSTNVFSMGKSLKVLLFLCHEGLPEESSSFLEEVLINLVHIEVASTKPIFLCFLEWNPSLLAVVLPASSVMTWSVERTYIHLQLGIFCSGPAHMRAFKVFMKVGQHWHNHLNLGVWSSKTDAEIYINFFLVTRNPCSQLVKSSTVKCGTSDNESTNH